MVQTLAEVQVWQPEAQDTQLPLESIKLLDEQTHCLSTVSVKEVMQVVQVVELTHV